MLYYIDYIFIITFYVAIYLHDYHHHQVIFMASTTGRMQVNYNCLLFLLLLIVFI